MTENTHENTEISTALELSLDDLDTVCGGTLVRVMFAPTNPSPELRDIPL